MKCYTDRAVDKRPKIWNNRNKKSRKLKSNEVQQRIQRCVCRHQNRTDKDLEQHAAVL